MEIKMLNEPIEVEFKGVKFRFFKLPLVGVFKLLKLISLIIEKTGISLDGNIESMKNIQQEDIFSDEILNLYNQVISIGTRLPMNIVEDLPADAAMFCFNTILERCVDKDFFQQEALKTGEKIKGLINQNSSTQQSSESLEKQAGN